MLFYTENHEICGCEMCGDKDAEVSCIDDIIFLCDECEETWIEEEWRPLVEDLTDIDGDCYLCYSVFQ